MELEFERYIDPITLVAVLATTNFLSFIIGAETIAGGSQTMLPIRLPGYVYGGRATEQFMTIYNVAESLLWLIALIYIVVTLGAMLEQSDEVVPWTTDDIDE
jgi:hypothetical protein